MGQPILAAAGFQPACCGGADFKSARVLQDPLFADSRRVLYGDVYEVTAGWFSCGGYLKVCKSVAEPFSRFERTEPMKAIELEFLATAAEAGESGASEGAAPCFDVTLLPRKGRFRIDPRSHDIFAHPRSPAVAAGRSPTLSVRRSHSIRGEVTG